MSRIPPDQFEELIYQSLRKAFATLLSASQGQTLYAFALFTDDSLQFLNPVANSEEALTAAVTRYQTKVDPKYGGTTTRSSLRWSYGDWGFFPNVDEGAFQEANELLSRNFDQMMEDDSFDGDVDLLFAAMLKGFQRAEAEGVFSSAMPRGSLVLLLVGNLPASLTDPWVTALNPPETASMYLHWIPPGTPELRPP
ncbi:DUF4303 domain-containing protein [Prosthecobacter sp.]|uniref:DUF4303 domain-containing protein n=1 Tax=Prosthecobacter sp. TaxID=1965333 RepID=UPI003784D61E